MKRTTELSDDNIYRNERYYGAFSRTIPLPVEVKPEQATANYKNGILNTSIPKSNMGKSKGYRVDITEAE